MRTEEGINDLPAETPHGELVRLANHVRIGGHDDHEEYRYRRPRPGDGDDVPLRPCDYPLSLDEVLRPQLQQADLWGQAAAIVAMKACQIHQTGWAGSGRRADEFERCWARLVHLGYLAKTRLEHVPGACWSCNGNPCYCVA